MTRKLEIDYDTADRITVLCLTDQLNYLEKELHEYEVNGGWMHPEDYHNSKIKLIPALKLIIDHYGGPIQD